MLTMGCRSKSGNRETCWEDLAMDHASTDSIRTRMVAVEVVRPGQILVCSEDTDGCY